MMITVTIRHVVDLHLSYHASIGNVGYRSLSRNPVVKIRFPDVLKRSNPFNAPANFCWYVSSPPFTTVKPVILYAPIDMVSMEANDFLLSKMVFVVSYFPFKIPLTDYYLSES